MLVIAADFEASEIAACGLQSRLVQGIGFIDIWGE
jgi:hypothetical protein